MDSQFDTIVLGTGLTQSIVAAALSKAGFRVAHIDENPYYGADEASLSLDELIKWADDRSIFPSDNTSNSVYMSAQRSRFTHISRSSTQLPHSRQYSLSLCPAIIPAIGPLISSMVSSGVSRYGGFRLLEQVGVYLSRGKVMQVPGSKEDIFKNKDISLLDKRRLMRFLLFAIGDFEGSSELSGQEQTPFLQFLKGTFTLNDDLSQVIAHSLAYCISSSDTTFPALQRLRRYLRSAGRYGPSSFIIGHYGGAGEISQGFSRTSAVHGGVYILGKRILSIQHVDDQSSQQRTCSHPDSCVVELEDFPDKLFCGLIVSPQDYIPSELLSGAAFMPSPEGRDYSIARCIAIIDQPVSFYGCVPSTDNYGPHQSPDSSETTRQTADNALLIFPPSSLTEGSSTTSVSVLVTGESSMAAPKGRWVLNLSMPILDDNDSPPPDVLLGPYLAATLSLTSHHGVKLSPLFTVFYLQHVSPVRLSTTPQSKPKLIVTPSISSLIPESLDSAAVDAEAIFHEAVGILRSYETYGPPDGLTENEGLWPPLNDIEDETEHW